MVLLSAPMVQILCVGEQRLSFDLRALLQIHTRLRILRVANELGLAAAHLEIIQVLGVPLLLINL